MYRGLKEEYMYSFADLYEKAIATCSSSKIYSMAGTRVGWIVCKDPKLGWHLFNPLPYESICGKFLMNGFCYCFGTCQQNLCKK